MASGCKRLDEVSTAAVDGNEDNPEAAKDTARDEFATCDLVFEKVAVVQEFYE